ncbi:hypothetical protein PVL29_026080 [Vitis rotundifolia]|uniref:60S ribosomal protein L18a-like protein n=1 Tax=Vitis rotundifolia TaxID=103349 RepID=A0AA38YLP0_VITRO|nr:hypothetical protein PVL29_026080 [Vitis rotundifolia]
MSEESKNRSDQHYGTFQGVPTYSQPPAIGFPQPVPPPGAAEPSAPPPPPPQYYAQGYQAVPGYAVAEGTPVRQRRLPCCGIGLGWFLFIIGFFLAAVPWYVGFFLLICARVDYREKPGYIACTIAMFSAYFSTCVFLFTIKFGNGHELLLLPCVFLFQILLSKNLGK